MSGYDFGIVTNILVGIASLFLKGEDEKKKRRGRIRQIKSKKDLTALIPLGGISPIMYINLTSHV